MKSSRRSFRNRLLRSASFPFVLVAAVWLWLEDWLWEPLALLMQRIGRLPLLCHIEMLIRSAPPWLALALYGVPVLVLLPFKFAGLWLFAKGHYFSGGGVFLLAKVAGTAVAAHLFTLTQASLMCMPWFAKLYARFISVREYVFCRVRRSRIWRRMCILRWRMKRMLRALKNQG